MCSYFASTHIVCICLFSNRKIEKMKMDYVFLFCLSLSPGQEPSWVGEYPLLASPPSLSPQHRIISTHFFYFPHHIYFAVSLRRSTTTQSLFCDPDNNKQCDSSEQGVDFQLWYLPIKNSDMPRWLFQLEAGHPAPVIRLIFGQMPPSHPAVYLENLKEGFLCKYICKWWKSSTYRRYESKSLNRHFFLQLRLNSAESHTGGSLIN